MPRVPESRPHQVVLDVGGRDLVVGVDGLVTWDDVYALRRQIEFHDKWRSRPVPTPLPADLVHGMCLVLECFPGSTIEDPYDELQRYAPRPPAPEKPPPTEADRFRPDPGWRPRKAEARRKEEGDGAA